MKYLLLLVTAFSFSVNIFSQTMRSSIGVGSASNKFIIYMKPDAGFSGTLSTVDFALGLPASTPAGVTCSVTAILLPGFTWQVTPSYLEGPYRVYDITTPASPTITMTANTEYPVMEVTFTGPTLTTYARSITLPDGGATTGNADFFCSGAIFSNGSDLYYTRPGPPPTTVQNGFSYGVTAGTDTSWSSVSQSTSSASDYFRSITSGNWNIPATWESSTTSNFASLISPATLTPDNNSAGIFVRNGHTVTVTTNVTTDNTFVNPGATLTVTGSTLTVVNNGLTVQSDATGTGRIGNSTGTISGNATVQRFIPANANRAWRLLSIPTTTVQSIRAAWQNGQASGVTGPTGLGMWITSKLSTAVANGYDAQTTGSSMLSYNAAGNSWTNVTTSTSATNIATDNGYLVYIRGDRTATNSNALITATTLSTTGALKQGIYPGIPISVTTGQFGSVGNPYASQIDFRNVTKTAGIDNLFYVWDPKLATTGGYQTLTLSGGNYVITPGGGSYGGSGTTMNTIESGMAFFVHATSAGTVQFTEGAKSTGNNNGVFGPNSLGRQLVTNLYAGNSLADGVLNLFDKGYSNAVDNNDALKLTNFGENLGIVRNGSILAVEKRSLIGDNDVIEFNLAGMRQMQYRLEFSAVNLNQPGLVGTLEDNYLVTKTPIDLDGITNMVFTVDANPASSAANRFRIVFKTAAVVVPLGKPDISIYPNPITSGNINVQFTNMQKGMYTLKLISSAGQTVMISQLNHPGGSAVRPVSIGRSLSKGSYRLRIIQPDGTMSTQQILVQ